MQLVRNVRYSLMRIYSRPLYLLLNIAFAIIYYYIFTAIVEAQNHGILLLINVPSYALYALIITASITLTLSVYSIRNTVRNVAVASSSGVGAFATVFGGLINGCGCSAPLLFSIFSSLFGSSAAIYLDYDISNLSLPLTLILVVANLLITIYYLNKFAKPSCNLRRSFGGKKKKWYDQTKENAN
ncbi:MAG: hypothetical protein QXN59_01595 [Candidatus Micrarchaeaceae archaeon]